ncbi:hypothetical protein [Kutzneria sp. NPDC051319]|uniref:hypothetical protein n=1 Tax=Kutzneria sp. NPDC051319 TaxID=3155047 RepID=UPI0034345B22
MSKLTTSTENRISILTQQIQAAYEHAFPTAEDRSNGVGHWVTMDIAHTVGELTRLAILVEYGHFDDK